MTNILDPIKRLFTPVKSLTPGIYHYQAPPDAPVAHRLHLRLEADGTGMLIINASTILHLNQTAAELAYHLVMQTPEDQMVHQMIIRYKVSREQVLQDYRNLIDNIQTLIHRTDLDPETYLDFERAAPYSQELSAPYRLDCALTYRLPEGSDSSLAPTKRVDRELTTEEWFTIFDKAWSVGIPHIILTGGEPTLRDDLPELIAHTEANGQVVGLLSDGLKLVDNNYLQNLLQTGLDHLMVMLQPENNASWRALENILAVDLFTAVHLTLTLQNTIDAPEVLERLSKMGVKAISLSAADPALHTTLSELRNHAASLGVSLVWDLPVPYSAFNPVALETQADTTLQGSGRAWLYVEPDGDVLPSQGNNQVLGNFLKDPWATLWQ
jgi:Radical SAM superfamily